MATAKISSTKSTSRSINYAEKRVYSRHQAKKTNMNKQQYINNLEKTPKWLNKSMRKIHEEEYDQDFEEKRKAFSKQLEKD